MTTPWAQSLRELHNDHFGFDWDSHVRRLNERLGLTGRDEFGLPAPGLPPAWFVGDVEGLRPGEWVLVISLNQARREEDEGWHRAQHYTRQSYWDHWRFLNRDWWTPRFYRPLVRLASHAIGVPTGPTNESEFTSTRMIFVELCPYASRQFTFTGPALSTLADDDLGFQLAARVRRVLIEQASPAFILVNGRPALDDFERLERDRVSLEERRYASVRRPEHTLWHKEGRYEGAGCLVPVVGFPFLRKPSNHNWYAEIDQLASMARRLLRPDQRS
ncbi:MAG: hypothetical protein FJ037_03675 [Chloroflexi bacterium]|nr:hypothetical protein [Chloroflexota bacterium]